MGGLACANVIPVASRGADGILDQMMDIGIRSLSDSC
jgi:hypothetical protein